jgi:hypothetical protein
VLELLPSEDKFGLRPVGVYHKLGFRVSIIAQKPLEKSEPRLDMVNKYFRVLMKNRSETPGSPHCDDYHCHKVDLQVRRGALAIKTRHREEDCVTKRS